MADSDAILLRDGEYYLNERTGRTHKRKPAGGVGGGVTSYVDEEASEAEHLAFMRMRADQKAAESDIAQQQRDEAAQKAEEAAEPAPEPEAEPEVAKEPSPPEPQPVQPAPAA